MVPGPAPADVLPKRTPETPGANGFELLPAAASAASSQASAKVTSPSAALVDDVSGFQMLPASAPAAMALAPAQGVDLKPAAASQSLAADLPNLRAEPASFAPPAEPVAAPAAPAKVAVLPPFLMQMRSAPLLMASPTVRKVSTAQPAVELEPLLESEPSAPILQLARADMAVQAPAQTPTELRPSLLAVQASVPSAMLAAEPEQAPVQLVQATLSVDPAQAVSADLAPLLQPVHAAAPSMLMAAETEATPVQVFQTALAIDPVQAAPADLRPLLEPVRASAPTAVFIAESEPVRAPVVLAAAEPLDLLASPTVVLEPSATRRRVRRRVPALTITRAPAAPRLQLARSNPLFLEAAPSLVDNGYRARPLDRSTPTVIVATVESSPTVTARIEVEAAPRPSIQVETEPRLIPATFEAPATHAPHVVAAAARAPEMIVATGFDQTAASADAAASPAAAVAAPAEAARPEASSQIIQLAQATPAPAPSPASAPAPAPAAPAPAPAAAAPPPAPAVAVQRSVVVNRIIVQGNERIEASTILSYLPIQPGDTVDAAKLDLALKTLHRTDLFADESLEMQGDDLIVKVSENPIINQVVFEGNHALKEDKLRDEVTVRPRGIFTRSRVEQDSQKIIELYRRSGRISATVTPKIVQLPQKRVDLIFEINEGPKSGIEHINFVGNKEFSDNALRDVVVTRESHWYKFFQSQDNYDPDRLEYDREQLRKFYRNHGFYDFRIISGVAELAPDKNGFVITFTVDEGPKYHFGKLKVTTELKRLNGELLQALLPIRQGQLYEDDRIEKATDAMTYAAGANGFAFVDVRPRYTAHPETRTVDVDFDIKEGPRVYVERIDVVGNTRTLDYVIRREMRVAEGDAYNRVLVDRSKQNIKALGYFKDVDIEQIPGSAPDKTVLRVKVTEQPTGQLSFSIGYSSLEKLVGDIGISETNFRGRGQRVDFEVSMGYLQKRVSLSFTEPRFGGRNMAAGFDLYSYSYNYSTTAAFTSSSTGGNLRVGFPINQYSYVTFRYSLHTDNVSLPTYVLDPVTGACTAGYSQTLCDEVGRTFTSSVGYTARLDHRNDPIIPTRGYYAELSQDFAGLGGVKYIRTEGDASWFYGFTPQIILSVKGMAGYITGWGGDSVRINDRFFKGGDSFRGFQIAGIGPRDTTVQVTQCSTVTNPTSVTSTGQCYGDALGAKAYAIGTVELQFPNFIPAQYGIKTALFSDFGTAGIIDANAKRNPNGTINPYIQDGLAFRASVGISVFWKSPMGPLRFDFSKVLKKTPYDVPETFYFSTATNFQ